MSAQESPDTTSPTNVYRIQQILHTRPVSALAWSPDGQRLIASTLDGTIDLWDVKTTTLFRAIRELPTPIWSITWSPDGQWISFRYTDERYWSNKARMDKVYADKPADKPPADKPADKPKP